MLYFLLAVEHLPAFYAQNFSIRFLLDSLQTIDERLPFTTLSFYHEILID